MSRFFRPLRGKANYPEEDPEESVSVIASGSDSPSSKGTMSTATHSHSSTTNDGSASNSNNNNNNNNEHLKVLFLSSDTGGGHRASAESLANQFKILYPGTTYDLLDVMAKDGVPPYNGLITSYKHLSAHPKQWNLLYKFTNSRAMEIFIDNHSKVTCERAIRKSIQEYSPDVVVSVHPMMTNVPVLSCQKISEKTGRYLPMFTVVTDLGSAHCLWFANQVDKMFIASDQIRELAKARGKVPDEKLVQIGLPIRNQFAVQADKMGDRTSDRGRSYQKKVREELELPHVDRKTVLVMGGGEGVGSLSDIVDHLYIQLTLQNIDALVLVVCGRNEKLKSQLETKNWNQLLTQYEYNNTKSKKPRRRLSDLSFTRCIQEPILTKAVDPGCMDGSVTQSIRKILSNSSLSKQNVMDDRCSGVEETVTIEGTHYFDQAISTSYSTEVVATAARNSPTNLAPMIESESEGEGEYHNDHVVDVDYDDDDNYGDDMKLKRRNKDDDEMLQTTPHRNSPKTGSQDVPSNSDAHATDGTDRFYAADSEEVAIPISPTSSPSAVKKRGKVTVVGLGFVTEMAEYMVASDVLVSKAGPGTIAEAAALSLPILLTSFLPGQEEGNVDFVVEKKFGSFIQDTDPNGIGEEVALWLKDEGRMRELSLKAKENGAPNAARDIVRNIGDLALKWKRINDGRDRLEREAEALRLGISLSDNVDDKKGSKEDSRDADVEAEA